MESNNNDRKLPFLSNKDSPMSNNNPSSEKTSSQYERKLARQRQLEQMEAAASGVDTVMELDTTSESSGLRSRTEVTRRFLHDDQASSQDTRRAANTMAPQRPAGSQNLFDRRPGDNNNNTGVNLMDHATGVYRELTPSERMMRNISGLFTSGRNSEFDAGAAESDMDYSYSIDNKRTSYSKSWLKSLLHDSKRRSVLTLVAAILVVIVAGIATLRMANPSEKVLREQNNERFNVIMEHIVTQGISHEATFEDFTSSEHHALRWVAYSDPARLDENDPMLLSRYALAVFFYNSFLTFEKTAGKQKSIEDGIHQWEGVPNPGWTRKDYWMTERGLCEWYGVHCVPKRVVNPNTGEEKLITQYDANQPPAAIQLRQNHIMGTLPVEFKALEDLKLIDLTANKLAGTFPTNLGRLFHLEYLHLPNNQIGGALPSDIGFLEGLKKLDLRSNQLHGALPAELNRLYNLESLLLDHNQITGKIPDMTNCKNLHTVHLQNNEIDERFPFSIVMQHSLKDLQLQHNQLKGTLPAEIESIRGLETIRLEFNQMNGALPHGMFAKMHNLTEVIFDNNRFTGQLPEDVTGVQKLKVLSLAGNVMEGPVPPELGTIKQLEKLHLNDNGLTGYIPPRLGSLVNLKELWMEGNRLQGPIPVQLGNVDKLESLHLDRNRLTGTIATELGYLSNLKTFKLETNNISGDMPIEVCDLKNDYSLNFLAADCKQEIDCNSNCCNECH